MSAFAKPPLKDLADIIRFETEMPFAHRCDAASVYDVFVKNAAIHPDRPALTLVMTGEDTETPRRVSYRQMLEGITQAANLFASIGGPAPGVAYLLPNLPETHFTLWGAETAGYALPLNFLLKPETIAELIRAAGATVLVTLGPHPQFDIWQKALAVREEIPTLTLLQVPLAGGTLPSEAENFATGLLAQERGRLTFGHARRGGDIAAYFHTGGTTGSPKLVAQTHRNQIVASFGGTVLQDLSETDVITCGFPLFHVAATISCGMSYFIAAAHVVVMSPAGMRNPLMLKNYWRIVERYGVTVISGVPTVLAALLNVPVDADISTARHVTTGGALTPRAVAEKFEVMTGKQVHEILGMTEAAGLISFDPAAGQRQIGSAGFRLPYTQVLIRTFEADGSLGRLCAPNEIGVMTIAGPHITPGYRDPRHNSNLRDDGYLDSGDLAYVDESGRLFIVGRAKDLIIRSGHNIDPVMIEAALQQHPAVALAAAVGQPDRYAGELPVCYVTMRPGAQATPEELRQFAEPLIAERPAWPKQVFIVDEIPMTNVGKIFKPQLRDDATRRLVADQVLGQAECREFSVDIGLCPKGRCQVTVTLPEAQAARQQEIEALLDGYLFQYRVVVPGEGRAAAKPA
jgi:fatty-acyl-CoA synthase